jgi:hypothetical protein
MSDEEKPAPKPRRKLTPIVLIVLVNLLGAGAFAYHKAKQARLRANSRACFSNQKHIVGAIEMAQLDFNVKLDNQPINADFIAFLINNSYLRNEPHDYGVGRGGTWKYYVRDESAPSGVRCLVHGAVPDYKDKNPPPPPEPVSPIPRVKTPERGLKFEVKNGSRMDWARADKLHADAVALGEP